MRAIGTFLLLFPAVFSLAQERPMDHPRLLVITEAVAFPLSAAQVEQAARQAWALSFGQEPGARIVQDGTGTGRIEGTARFNFKSTATGSRQGTLGVIDYQIGIQAENGLCRVRISDFSHTGNRHAPGGPVSLGRIYAGTRPRERVPGISLGVAQRLNDDMREQVGRHLSEVAKAFFLQLRKTAQTE